MQTFVPLPSFGESAKVLDWRRLCKQRVECKQICNALQFNTGWKNHPATKMWTNYQPALRQYMRVIILEWIDRGYNNNMEIPEVEDFVYPYWWNGDIHASHRAALLEKNFEWYSQFNWKEKPKINYVWPVA